MSTPIVQILEVAMGGKKVAEKGQKSGRKNLNRGAQAKNCRKFAVVGGKKVAKQSRADRPIGICRSQRQISGNMNSSRKAFAEKLESGGKRELHSESRADGFFVPSPSVLGDGTETVKSHVRAVQTALMRYAAHQYPRDDLKSRVRAA